MGHILLDNHVTDTLVTVVSFSAHMYSFCLVQGVGSLG